VKGDLNASIRSEGS